MIAILDQREMPPKLNHSSQFAALLIGTADRLSGGVIDSEHAGTLHEIARPSGRSANLFGEGPVLPRLEDEAGLATLDPGRVAA